jgi:hypothetical protein
MEYRDQEEALIGLARQLADAYEEAQTADDREYAAGEIVRFISESGEDAPDDALIALLDLPRSDMTTSIIDTVEALLTARGPGAIEALLVASRGHVYDIAGPSPQRALETLSAMVTTETGDAVQGLIEVLSGSGDQGLKDAAVAGLVAIGPPAIDQLRRARNDRVAAEWVEDALGELGVSRAGASFVRDSEPAELEPEGEASSGDDASDGPAGEAEPGQDETAAGPSADDPACFDGEASASDAEDGLNEEAAGDTGTGETRGGIGDAGIPDEVPALPDSAELDRRYRAFADGVDGGIEQSPGQ